RRRLPASIWRSLVAACPGASAFLAVTAIYWRCAWKYGERAFRLTHLDAGHAVAAFDAAAALDGSVIHEVDARHSDLAGLLALGSIEDPEAEDAVCLLALAPPDSAPVRPWRPDPREMAALRAAPPEGEPSLTSEGHRRWPGIVAAARSSRSVGAEGESAVARRWTWPAEVLSRDVLRRRRSRSTYGDGALDRRTFCGLVDMVVGDAGLDLALATLVLVHRVDGVEPGLYAALDRGAPADRVGELRGALRPTFAWARIDAGGRGWDLVRLSAGDARAASSHLAGGQSAAGGGAFTALFLGDLGAMERRGASAYRHLHRRSGVLGHRLYLGAEAGSLGATGLAGFFDESLRSLLGLGLAEA
ncbi:MAG: hypothetical protein AAFX50_25210, partial [Acidobacteriota bacterium]